MTSTKNYLTDFLNKIKCILLTILMEYMSTILKYPSIIVYELCHIIYVCTLEVVQTEDSPVSIDFSLTVDLLVEFGHILVSIESNMNSMLD